MRQTTDSISSAATSSETAVSYAGSTDKRSVSLSGVLPEARFFSGRDIACDEYLDDLKDAPEGDWQGKLIVYRIGKVDPMLVVAAAMARGAAGILTEQVLPCPLPQCIVPDVEHALGKLDAALLHRPDRKLLTVGVVGSAGKTTTSLLVSTVLRGAGIRVAYQNDLGECDGVVQVTPETRRNGGSPLIRWIGEAVDADSQAAIIELSEDHLRRGDYDAIEFDVLIMTGTTSNQDDFGPAALSCAIEQLTRDGIVIVSADDKVGARLVADAGVRTITYGLRGAADVSGKIIDQSDHITTSLITYDDTTLAMETALCGSAMAANHLAAIAFGLLIDRPLTVVVEALGVVRELPGRNQRLTHEQAADVVLDVARTPVQVAAALRAARSMRGSGKLWCVLAIDADHDALQLTQFGRLMERFADHAIVTSSHDAKPSFLKRSHDVLDGVQKCAAFRLVADQNRAIDWAMQEAGDLDTVLVLGGVSARSARQQRTDLETLANKIETASREHANPRPAFRVVG